MEQQILDPVRQQQAKQYAKIRRRLLLVDLFLGTALLLAWLLTGLSAWLRDWISTWTSNPWIALAAYAGVLGAVFTILDLPLSLYSGYILPHRFQQSTQTFTSWLQDQGKSLGLSALLGMIILEMIYLILRSAPDSWWLWAGAFLFLFNVVLANLAPVLLFPIFYSFQPLEDDHQDLQDRLVKLAGRAGVPVMGVYSFDMSRQTKSANAGLTGLGNTRRIILGDTLLEAFSADEIETVLAHELGHQVNHDIPLGMAFQTLLTLAGLYLTSLGLSWSLERFGFASLADIAALPLLGLFLGVYGVATLPLGNAFSRSREVRADRFALELTGNGRAYADALIRLGNQNLAEVDPEPWVEFLLYSHPALERRIQMAASHPQPS